MKGNQFAGALRLILLLILATVPACSVAAPAASVWPVTSESQPGDELTGVWTGTSITGCMPLRMDGPLRCGARADLRLTIIREDSTTLSGFFASDRSRNGSFFRETGSIVTVPTDSSTTMWLRVITADRASCLFDTNVGSGEMGGSYLCFRNGTSLERGRWVAWRNY